MWKSILKSNFTNLNKLSDFLELSLENRKKLTHSNFVLNLPVRLAAKIQKNNLNDPIFRQFVPLMEENEVDPSFIKDPLAESSFKQEGKLLSKYPTRSLIITTSACAMHCRYCFRRAFPYETDRKDFAPEIERLRQDASLEEVILSGGDPLSLPNERLKALFNDLNSIEHLKRIRFHTRFPIGIPERIDEEFLDILKNSHKQIWFVIHCNHPSELDEDVLSALKSLQKLGIPVLNQSVLLKGVNDTLEILEELSRTLSNNGIQPYYLHQLDRVEGAKHFEVDPQRGVQLVEQLSNRLSGFMIPKYVKEIPHKSRKTPLI